eukprot:TRINITY_DN168_c1_g1_i2.p1 TRINITY_DN168_c1_g1~~TRINITY_DN168_c1_g1_i2.p1  ORF type:complete len:577 (+),score=110.44 TRINITY_DN168_c1_g1_i2:68-1732(+)
MAVAGYGDLPVRVCAKCYHEREHETVKVWIYTSDCPSERPLPLLMRMLLTRGLNRVAVQTSDAGRLSCPSCKRPQYPGGCTVNMTCNECDKTAPLPSEGIAGYLLGNAGAWTACAEERRFAVVLPKTESTKGRCMPAPERSECVADFISELVRAGAERKPCGALPLWKCGSCRLRTPLLFGSADWTCDRCDALLTPPRGWAADAGHRCSVCGVGGPGLGRVDDDRGGQATVCLECQKWVHGRRERLSLTVVHSSTPGVVASAVAVQCLLRLQLQASPVCVHLRQVCVGRCPKCGHREEQADFTSRMTCGKCGFNGPSPRDARGVSGVLAKPKEVVCWEPIPCFMRVSSLHKLGRSSKVVADGFDQVSDAQYMTLVLRELEARVVADRKERWPKGQPVQAEEGSEESSEGGSDGEGTSLSFPSSLAACLSSAAGGTRAEDRAPTWRTVQTCVSMHDSSRGMEAIEWTDCNGKVITLVPTANPGEAVVQIDEKMSSRLQGLEYVDADVPYLRLSPVRLALDLPADPLKRQELLANLGPFMRQHDMKSSLPAFPPTC